MKGFLTYKPLYKLKINTREIQDGGWVGRCYIHLPARISLKLQLKYRVIPSKLNKQQRTSWIEDIIAKDLQKTHWDWKEGQRCKKNWPCPKAVAEFLNGHLSCNGSPGEEWGSKPKLGSPAQNTRARKRHLRNIWL